MKENGTIKTATKNTEDHTMTLTDNEKAIIAAIPKSEYANTDDYSSTFTFSAIEHSGLDAKVARGALASLVKKGMVEVSDPDWGAQGETTIFLTYAGLAQLMALQLHDVTAPTT